MEDELELILEDEEILNVNLENDVVKHTTTNYPELNDKPSINDVELIGNKTSKELKLQDEMESISNLEIDEIFNL